MFSKHTSNLPSYSLDSPIIYQLEIVGGTCNLKCPVCPVTENNTDRVNNYFSLATLDKLISEEAFKNTFYLELQMYGEPTMHRNFDEIVSKLKTTGVKLGLSTNATIWREGFKQLDFITISADSRIYRVGRNEEHFWKVVDKIINETNAHIDLQVIEINDWKKQVKLLEEKYKDKSNVLIRTIGDNFGDTGRHPLANDVCINPFISVSVDSDGDVVPCCFMNNKEYVYGNINTNSLKEIWEGQLHKDFVESWLSGNIIEKCKNCRMRSPQLLHYRFAVEWERRGWL
jgi:radical SAM protein with 4Fe4S-binding SPASM domain